MLFKHSSLKTGQIKDKSHVYFSTKDIELLNWEERISLLIDGIWCDDPLNFSTFESFLNYLFFTFSSLYLPSEDYTVDEAFDSDGDPLDIFSNISSVTHAAEFPKKHFLPYNEIFHWIIKNNSDATSSDHPSSLSSSSASKGGSNALSSHSIDYAQFKNQFSSIKFPRDSLYGTNSNYFSNEFCSYYYPHIKLDKGLLSDVKLSSSWLADIIRNAKVPFGIIVSGLYYMRNFCNLSNDFFTVSTTPKLNNYQKPSCNPPIQAMYSNSKTGAKDTHHQEESPVLVSENKYMKYLRGSFPFWFYFYSNEVLIPNTHVFIPSNEPITPASLTAYQRRRYRLIVIVFIMIATKYHQDRHYSNQVWSELSKFNIKLINSVERIILNGLGYNLCIDQSSDDYMQWFQICKNYILNLDDGSGGQLSQIKALENTYPLNRVDKKYSFNSSVKKSTVKLTTERNIEMRHSNSLMKPSQPILVGSFSVNGKEDHYKHGKAYTTYSNNLSETFAFDGIKLPNNDCKYGALVQTAPWNNHHFNRRY